MNARALLPRLEAWTQEELGVQQRLVAALAEHEAALGRGRPEEVEASLVALERLDPRGPARRRELDALLRELAGAWQLASGSLTLGSVAERFGPDGQRLAAQRERLREATLAVRERARRVAAVARSQREVVRQVLETVLGREGMEGERGALVDARG